MRAANGILRKVTLFVEDENFCKGFYASANYTIQFCASFERGENKRDCGIHTHTKNCLIIIVF